MQDSLSTRALMNVKALANTSSRGSPMAMWRAIWCDESLSNLLVIWALPTRSPGELSTLSPTDGRGTMRRSCPESVKAE